MKDIMCNVENYVTKNKVLFTSSGLEILSRWKWIFLSHRFKFCFVQEDFDKSHGEFHHHHNLTRETRQATRTNTGGELPPSQPLCSLSALDPSNLSTSSLCTLTCRGSSRLFLKDFVRTELWWFSSAGSRLSQYFDQKREGWVSLGTSTPLSCWLSATLKQNMALIGLFHNPSVKDKIDKIFPSA